MSPPDQARSDVIFTPPSSDAGENAETEKKYQQYHFNLSEAIELSKLYLTRTLKEWREKTTTQSRYTEARIKNLTDTLKYLSVGHLHAPGSPNKWDDVLDRPVSLPQTIDWEHWLWEAGRKAETPWVEELDFESTEKRDAITESLKIVAQHQHGLDVDFEPDPYEDWNETMPRRLAPTVPSIADQLYGSGRR